MAEAATAVLVMGLAGGLAFWAFLHADTGAPRVRRALISASIVVGVGVFVISEGLSAIGALDQAGVLVAWLALDAGLVVVNTRLGWRAPLAGLCLPRPETIDALLVAGCGVSVAVTLLIALVAAPNNWDAMTYHMARVGYWVQVGNVDYHAAHTLNRDYQAPLASYAMLDLFLLSASDRLVNLVDWASFVGTMVGASLIAAQLGVGVRGQALAGLVVATLPMAILQASSSQNHIVVAYWLVALAAVALEQRGRPSWRAITEAALFVGLAVATKGSAYLFAAGFAAWVGLSALRAFGPRALPRLLLITILPAALLAPTVVRNLELFAAPLGPSDQIATYFLPSAITPGTMVERALQEASLQLGTPSQRVDRIVGEAFEGIAGALGLDLRDPRVVQPTAPWEPSHVSLNEDNAGNLLAFVLIVAVAGWIVARRRGLPFRYLLAVAVACLLYLALLRFTVWNSRWSLALFVLAAPLVGVALDSRRSWLAGGLGAILLVAAVPWLFFSYDRPLIGPKSVLVTDRSSQYFAMRPELEAPYRSMAAAISASGCRDVGFALGGDEAWEYPLWRLLNPTGHEVAIRDVLVANATSLLERPGAPCRIVVFHGELQRPATYHGSAYQLVASNAPFALYAPMP